MMNYRNNGFLLALAILLLINVASINAFVITTSSKSNNNNKKNLFDSSSTTRIISSTTTTSSPSSSLLTLQSSTTDDEKNVEVQTKAKDDKIAETSAVIDYDIPEDAVIQIKPKAMNRLRELREKQQSKSMEGDQFMVLRMGVRNGGCSGLSYVMDFASEADINDEDDQVDEYTNEKIKCVVDSKSMLYLYGLELDYSDELIGGGFKFFNPNAEESCGCGSSFGV